MSFITLPMRGKPQDVAATVVTEVTEVTEEQQYLRAIIAVRAVAGGPLGASGVENMMNQFFHLSESDGVSRDASLDAPTRIDTVYKNSTLEAVDFFVEFCILMFVQGYGTSHPQPSGSHTTLRGKTADEKARILSIALLTSMWNDKQRIRIALLRFQLYCELFHHPDSKGPGPECDWEERLAEQLVFWLH
jgi:hypothetical protein